MTSPLERSQHRLAEAVQRLEAALAESRGDAGAAPSAELAAVQRAHDQPVGAIARVDEMLGEAETRDAAE